MIDVLSITDNCSYEEVKKCLNCFKILLLLIITIIIIIIITYGNVL